MASTTSQRPNFLRLPAELRNQIYRLALVQENGIKVFESGHTRSGLLAASQQIRSESIKIYYLENCFHVDLPNFNIATFVKFDSIIRGLGFQTRDQDEPVQGVMTIPDAKVSGRAAPHWGNVVEWMRVMHSGEITTFQYGPSFFLKRRINTPLAITISQMARTVVRLRKVDWDVVRQILEDQRPIFGHMVDQRWMEDAA